MIHLKIHVESIHEGVRYPCDKCPYKATTISSLKRHGESIHEGELIKMLVLCLINSIIDSVDTTVFDRQCSANVTCKF